MKEIQQFLVAVPLLLVAPTQAVAETAENLEIQAPPEVTILDVAADESAQPDGLRVRWTSVTYELSTGHEAEMFVEVDDRGRGDGYIFLEGEALMHVTSDEHGATTTWVAPGIDLPPEALAQLTAVNLADEIFAGVGDPLAFKCSEFGKRAVRVAKYLWIGITGAAMGACCAGSVGAACPPCAAAFGVAGAIGSDVADDYCE